jgi:hypothetical protein
MPDTVHLATPSPTDTDHFVWGIGTAATNKYTGCATATPSSCQSLQLQAAEQANCHGCLSYQQGQHCGTDMRIVGTDSSPVTKTSVSSRRPCLCDADNACCGYTPAPDHPVTMWLVGGDGTCPIPTPSPAGTDVTWQGGSGGTVDTMKANCQKMDTTVQGGCHWSDAAKACIPQQCEYRTNSATCNKGTTGQSTANETYTCVWVGTQGGTGRCIHADCHNRCDSETCLTVVEDSRIAHSGPCMWATADTSTSSPKSVPLVSHFCSKGTVGGVCMPQHCSERGKFQPSYLDRQLNLVPQPELQGGEKLQQNMHWAELWGQEQCNLNPKNVSLGTGTSCGAVTCKSTEQCVYQHGAKTCQTVEHLPHCAWHPQATNPTAGICPSIATEPCKNWMQKETCQLHGQCTWKDGACSSANNASEYVRARTLSKGSCTETNQSIPQRTHLTGASVASLPPNSVFEAYHRSSSYDYACNCHFAPLGFCEKTAEADQSCPAGCHEIDGICTSNAYTYCAQSCSVLESPPKYICPTPCPELSDQNNPNPGCSSKATERDCGLKCTWHDSTQDGVAGTCVSFANKSWLGLHTVDPQRIAQCTHAQSEAACSSQHCTWDGTTCLARPMFEVDHAPVSCDAMQKCKACKVAHWGEGSTRTCDKEAERVAGKRNNCLAQCMSQPRNFCQHHCAASNCTALCYRTEVSGMHTWKGVSACRHNKLASHPLHATWVQDCAHHLQQPCLNTRTGSIVHTGDPTCTQEDHAWARPAMYQKYPPFVKKNKAYFCTATVSKCKMTTPATCNGTRGCMWQAAGEHGSCTTTAAVNNTCQLHSKTSCQADQYCLWDDDLHCQGKGVCNHNTTPCNPDVCNGKGAAYCPCQQGEQCTETAMCSIAWDSYQHAGVDTQPHSAASPVKHCPTHKCAQHHQGSCQDTCIHQHHYNAAHSQHAPHTTPPTCPANMPWRYGNATAGGMYCCDHYMGSTMNRRNVASLSDCTQHGADGTYSATHFIPQHPAHGCCLTPGQCWPDERGEIPPNCDGSRPHGLSCRHTHRDPLQAVCSKDALDRWVEDDICARSNDCHKTYGCFMTYPPNSPKRCVSWGQPCTQGSPSPCAQGPGASSTTVPPACLQEQCRHHYCNPLLNPDLPQQFPAELSQQLHGVPVQGWAGCAAGYCLDDSGNSRGWCTTDQDCSSSASCVLECGESGLGCYPLWAGAGTCSAEDSCTPGEFCVQSDTNGLPGQRTVRRCNAEGTWQPLKALFSATQRPKSFPDADIDGCLQRQCIHSEGVPLPYVAAYSDSTPCSSPPYPTLEACQADMKRHPGACPQACPTTPQPLHLTQQECGKDCASATDETQCWDGKQQQCVPRLPMDRITCEQNFHCWDGTLSICFPRPSEQTRCNLPPEHLRIPVNKDELTCRHTHGLCWSEGKCFKDLQQHGCNVREHARILPVLADGTTAQRSTTRIDCLNSGHCWKACQTALGKEQYPACQTACTLSTNDRCHIPPTNRVPGLGADQHSATACLASSHHNCWDAAACNRWSTEATCAAPCHWTANAGCHGGQCYLGGAVATANAHVPPLAQPCAPASAQSLDGYVCNACSPPPGSPSPHALCWDTPPPATACTLGTPCPFLGVQCQNQNLQCQPTDTCAACWATAARTPTPCTCPMTKPYYRNGTCQSTKGDAAVHTTLLPAVTVYTWEGLHAPVELPGLYPLGPCTYTPSWAANAVENACPRTLSFPQLDLLSQKQVDAYNTYATVTAIATHLPRLVDTPQMRLMLPVGPQSVAVTMNEQGGRIQLQGSAWTVLSTTFDYSVPMDMSVVINKDATTLACPLSHPHASGAGGADNSCCTEPWADITFHPLGTCTAVPTMCTVQPRSNAAPFTLDQSCDDQCTADADAQCHANCTVAQKWLFRGVKDVQDGISTCHNGCIGITDKDHCTQAQVCQWTDDNKCQAHSCSAATRDACHATARNCQWQEHTASPLHLLLDTAYSTLAEAEAACTDCTGVAVLGVPGQTHSSFTAYYLLHADAQYDATGDSPLAGSLTLPVFGSGTQQLTLDHVPYKDPHAIPGVQSLYQQLTLEPSPTAGPQTVYVSTCPEHQVLLTDGTDANGKAACHTMTIAQAWTAHPHLCPGQACTPGHDCPAATCT